MREGGGGVKNVCKTYKGGGGLLETYKSIQGSGEEGQKLPNLSVHTF